MDSYPADEGRISDVERGRSCGAVVTTATGGAPSAGDTILFALAHTASGQEPRYISGGDSVRVLLTEVTELGQTDPVTGRALLRLSWAPLGQAGPPSEAGKPLAKPRGARGRG